MPKSRIILLVLLAIATILAIQNWSGAISLTFLGMKTMPLPLSVWILLGLSAGAFTSGLISILLEVPARSVTTGQARSRPVDTSAPEVNRDKRKSNQSGGGDRSPQTQERQAQERQYREGEEFAQEPRDRQGSAPENRTQNYANYDDEPWDDEEDWLFEPEERSSYENAGYEDAGRESGSASKQNFPNRRTVYEIPQEPIGETHSGSMYSYTYKNKDDYYSNEQEADNNNNLEESTTESREGEIGNDAEDFFEDNLDYRADSETTPRETGYYKSQNSSQDNTRESIGDRSGDNSSDSGSAPRQPIGDRGTSDSYSRDSGSRDSGSRDSVQDVNYRTIEAPSQPLDFNGKQAKPEGEDDDWDKKQYNNDEW
ncbi:MAG: hypothetical protein F6J93_33480 [Oscillatoria sp. SIO1A7]|nr:hypothetical protein [Oscillatoria sp. SIO1A7]